MELLLLEKPIILLILFIKKFIDKVKTVSKNLIFVSFSLLIFFLCTWYNIYVENVGKKLRFRRFRAMKLKLVMEF